MKHIDSYAVFGHPIEHSKSPLIHKLFAIQTEQQIEYTSQNVPADQFIKTVSSFFEQGGKGLNCTLPLKELAWEYAECKTERAEISKAVNTLAMQSDGTVLGDNTDGHGLIKDLITNNSINLSNIKILVLGAGGASRGIIGPLLEKNPERIVIANRTINKAKNLAEEFNKKGEIYGCGFESLKNQQFDLIINATSASLSSQLPPLPSDLLIKEGNCYDLAYGNEPTTFVRWGIKNNASKSMDGLGMLVEQAAEAFFIWRGINPETKPVIDFINSQRVN